MPLKSGRLTKQERVFANTMADTGDKAYAAHKAQYAQPVVQASRALARPAVAAEIAKREQDRLFNEGLPAAVGLLIRNVTDPKVAPGAANQAAKIILDHTLGRRDGQGDRREAHEMSGDELAREIERLKREVAERARPVEVIEGGLFD